MGSRGERNLHLVVFHPREGGGIQTAEGWPLGRGWGPGGRHALWPWGVGEHGGALTGGAPTKRCGGSGWVLVPLIRAAWLGDATGARSGPLAKMAVLHRTSCGLPYGRIRPASPWASRCSCVPSEPPASGRSVHPIILDMRHFLWCNGTIEGTNEPPRDAQDRPLLLPDQGRQRTSSRVAQGPG